MLFFIVNELTCDIIKQINKSVLTELFRTMDASCPKGKKMEHRKSLTKSGVAEVEKHV